MTSICGLLLPGMTLNSTIFPDLPFPTFSVEFNRSSPQPADRPAKMRDYLDSLVDRLDTEPMWQQATQRIVIAHSFGGMLAQMWLSSGHTTSKDVDHLLLIATTAGPMYDVVRLKLGTLGGRDIRLGIDTAMTFWNSSIVTKTMKRVMTGGTLAVRDEDFRTIANPTDLRIDFAGWRNTDWRAMRSFRSAMDGFDTRRDLARITTPTIVLHGADDALFPPHVGQALADGLPNAVFKQIQGARHVLPLTHGDVVQEAVGELLAVR